MNISYRWLKELARFDLSPQELAVLLTDTGLEVESLEHFEPVKGGLKGVFVGHVLHCEKHPDADRLSLTRVGIGKDEDLQIVCGAPNVRTGQKVLVATVGTTLHTEKGSFEIKEAKIRGQISRGMICAEDELGLGTSHDGIMVLPGDAVPGTPAAAYLGFEDDWVFTIGLTPNRIDAASHLGVARDVVAVLNHRSGNRHASVDFPDLSRFSVSDKTLHIPVTIQSPEACTRYSGLTIRGVRVQESPRWLKDRLMAIGQKPINNVVDITNYVLHELGQPLHAFDAAAIQGQEVVVRKPGKGTEFVTLDAQNRILTGEDLMICNAKESMCMAGILGGLHSGVTEKTTDIFLESACFDPRHIRRSSNHHAIKTDASFRFERGSDPDMVIPALKRAAMLICEIAGGVVSSDVVDVYPQPVLPAEVVFHFDKARTLMGKSIGDNEMIGILQDLDFSVQQHTNGSVRLIVPPYRVDVLREADVVEEVLRIYGYNNIELPDRLYSSIVLSPKPDKEKLQNIVSDMLVSRGFSEIMNNSLTRSTYFEPPAFDPGRSVAILNPLSQDLNVLRQSLLFGGLETIAYNQNRKTADMQLFEFGNIYFKKVEDNPGAALDAYGERMQLAIFLTGKNQPESWKEARNDLGIFDCKATVELVLERLGLRKSINGALGHENNPFFAFGQDLSIDNIPIASFGLLSDGLTSRFDIKQPVYYAVIEWERLMQLNPGSGISYRDIPRHPEVRRDLALLLPRDIAFAELEMLAYQTESKLLKKVGIFDVYQDDKLGRDKKSYALSFVLQDAERTLTDREIDAVMEKLAAAFETRFQARIR